MVSSPAFRIKRGATFEIPFKVKLGDDPEDIRAWTITSHVRHNTGTRELVAALNVVLGPEPDDLLITGPSDSWPIALLAWDVKLVTDSGQTTYTETVVFEVEAPETRP